jgi:hypothetical protein
MDMLHDHASIHARIDERIDTYWTFALVRSESEADARQALLASIESIRLHAGTISDLDALDQELLELVAQRTQPTIAERDVPFLVDTAGLSLEDVGEVLSLDADEVAQGLLTHWLATDEDLA